MVELLEIKIQAKHIVWLKIRNYDNKSNTRRENSWIGQKIPTSSLKTQGDQTIDSIAEGLYVMGREECRDPGVPEDGFLAEVG